VDSAGRGDGECLQTLQCSTQEWLERVAIAPGLQRSIAGRFGQGNSGASGDDAAIDCVEYRVYL
jgi:hypothetical protein